MDARERLRRYLEQRRELGESELVLDGMSVEEVMRLLGAANLRGGTGGAPGRREPAAHEPPPEWGMVAPDADYGAPADHPDLNRAPEPPRADPPRADPPRPERPRADVPREVAEAAGTGDWRAALRAAGGAPDHAARRADPDEPAGAGMAPSSAPGAAAVPDPAAGERPPVRPAASAGVPADAARLVEGLGVPLGLVVGGDRRELFGGPFDHLDSIDAIAAAVARCTRCPLHKTATNPVPGEGNPDADLVVVGEAPGAEEDATGRPFVGASGQLLTKILAAISLRREDVFICNVVKHRPPGNRNPAPDEVEACSPYLVRQLELLRPKVILTLGNFAAQTLLATKLGITKLRGQVHLYHGIPLVPTYHPAALLRNEAWKRPTWEDVKLARRILDRAREG